MKNLMYAIFYWIILISVVLFMANLDNIFKYLDGKGFFREYAQELQRKEYLNKKAKTSPLLQEVIKSQ